MQRSCWFEVTQLDVKITVKLNAFTGNLKPAPTQAETE